MLKYILIVPVSVFATLYLKLYLEMCTITETKSTYLKKTTEEVQADIKEFRNFQPFMIENTSEPIPYKEIIISESARMLTYKYKNKDVTLYCHYIGTIKNPNSQSLEVSIRKFEHGVNIRNYKLVYNVKEFGENTTLIKFSIQADRIFHPTFVPKKYKELSFLSQSVLK
ncbi:MAG: hypothetical protein H7A24_02690 [Leptospiraceae bacterium]|nr:hypothetical protein [Leptospiraceae bacterium]MCP5510757.1 hypothetical protein [Leptospiraceae bacterium]